MIIETNKSVKNFERFHSFEKDICNCVKKYKQKKKETFITIGRVLLMLDSWLLLSLKFPWVNRCKPTSKKTLNPRGKWW
jgi:hypothetical protein